MGSLIKWFVFLLGLVGPTDTIIQHKKKTK